MTDNEIRNNLMFIAHYCHDEYNEIRVDVLLLEALDLINRQQAEIEELEAEYEKVYEQAEADILGNLPQGGASCHWCIDKHKKYAIKEFAERLKEAPIKFSYPLLGLSTKDEITDYFNNIMMQFKDAIDNLVKEMVGDAE